MKHFTSGEVGGLVLAAFFLFGGLACVIWPRAGVVVHFGDSPLGSAENSIESVTRAGARTYGILAMCFGSGIAALAVYPAKT